MLDKHHPDFWLTDSKYLQTLFMSQFTFFNESFVFHTIFSFNYRFLDLIDLFNFRKT